ncbi:MAG: enoyl-CoA hydratase/isomerase family protein [Phycisphaerales bacterium]|nr:enoyl-CoA hydratase/isomerase family protein [Phycisphaerales bacterium]
MTATPFRIETEETGPFAGIASLWLEQDGRPVVVLDEPLIRRLEATLQTIPRSCAGLVVASASAKVFVAGADLKSISELDDTSLDQYLAYGQRVFGLLAAAPFPTAAAINGAALGGGLEVAMHCDGLIACPGPGGKPYPVGLPEAGLSICPGWGGTNLLPARMGPGEGIRRTATGKTMLVHEARDAGLFDAFAPTPEELLPTAKRWISDRAKEGRPERDGAPSRWIGRPRYAAACLRALDACRAELPETGSALAVAEAVHAGLTQGWQAALDTERRRLVALRSSPEGKAAIQTFFERSAAKS